MSIQYQAKSAATLLFLSAFLALSAVNSLHAQTSFPMITHAYPVALQRGTTTEIEVAGQMNFAGAYKALFEGDGISAEVTGTPPAPAVTVKSVKMKVTVAKDATLGVREFRVATALGLSSVGQL